MIKDLCKITPETEFRGILEINISMKMEPSGSQLSTKFRIMPANMSKAKEPTYFLNLKVQFVTFLRIYWQKIIIIMFLLP